MIDVAIIIGSARPSRKAPSVARWVHAIAAKRDDAVFEVVDIADYDLPHLDEASPAMMGQYSQAHTSKWSRKIAAFDAYVFVTPEYNHSTSGALKNAIDFCSPSGTTRPSASSVTGFKAVRAPSSTSVRSAVS